MIEVERYGALRGNGIGSDRSAFPPAFSVGEADGSWRVDGSAAAPAR